MISTLFTEYSVEARTSVPLAPSSNHLHVVAQIESEENSDETLVICLALHDGIAAWELV